MRKHSKYKNSTSVHDQDIVSDTTSETAVGSPLSGDEANAPPPTKRYVSKLGYHLVRLIMFM